MPENSPRNQPARRSRRRLLAVALVIVVLVVGAGLVWFAWPQQVLPEAEAALVSTPELVVTNDGGTLTFRSTAGETTGFILYPGAKVPPAGYAVPARAIAEQGYLVVIPAMPLNFAVFNPDAALAVIAAHPEVTTWAVGGHSLGGAMAGQFVAGHPDTVDGLVLWAAYSASDVSTTGVEAGVIYGSLDAGAERITSPNSLAFLPAGTPVVEIEGGNHANFGSYTGQANDPPATISREEQQAQAVAATVELLKSISPNSDATPVSMRP
jgi:hypothetical protein